MYGHIVPGSLTNLWKYEKQQLSAEIITRILYYEMAFWPWNLHNYSVEVLYSDVAEKTAIALYLPMWVTPPWASYQIRKFADCACVFPAYDFKRNR